MTLRGPREDANKSGAFLSFSGDAEDEPVDLFAEAQKAVDDMDAVDAQEEEEEEDDDAEPEDDFNAAWEVLDLARAIHEKQQDESDEVKMKLADVFITLGDVSLETGAFISVYAFNTRVERSFAEKFDQAITDYSAGLALKTDLLPLSSRQIAEAHYKLSIVLDLTSGRLGDSITHAERALDSVEARLAELRAALSGQGYVKPESSGKKEDVKGKGKATSPSLLGTDAIAHMSKSQMEAEEKELQGLREDLALKVLTVICPTPIHADTLGLAGGGTQDVAERASRVGSCTGSEGARSGVERTCCTTCCWTV